jgi:mannose-1-phosphate guanylyltransferase
VQALILAGGEGTRLRPLTSTVPKPVLPLANRPFISYMLDWLVLHGIDDVVMSCGFLGDRVRAVLGDGDGRVGIRYVEEDEPLGTAGAVKHAEAMLDERFAVLNGDILADFDLTALQRFHAEHGATGTISLIPVDDPSAYGLVRTDAAGHIEGFLEKPSPEEIDTNLINAGAYVLEREVLERIEPGRATSFEREVFPSLVGEGLYGFAVTGYWLDIGTPERYLEATYDILEARVETVVGERLAESGVAVGDGSRISAAATLTAPALLGAGCEVADGAAVGGRAVLGAGCKLAADSRVENAVLHDGVTIGPGAVVRDSIVGAGAEIGASSRVEACAVIGPGAVVEPRSTIVDGARVEAPEIAA